ncbi:hypothetical protein K431DRAFT_228313 [Polychaeton citri CBS 116435]|uniref:Uncharacterized protein n=1 Tax=Polychaeton citri CBS 116435 TaxID=1314669 RepID=A0A9P4UNA2_9PEZI|nr:hypothetical protein K431DRAFT_228313 [Polychaeton citri CBS 116435]
MNGPSTVQSRFYRNLVLAGIVTGGNVAPKDQKNKRWGRFLDSLCWLCDHRTGGVTVTSICAEAADDSLILWVAVNGGAKDQYVDRIMDQLEKVKKDLQLVAVSNTTMHDPVELISTNAIKFSRDKVKNYIKNLLASLKSAIKDEEELENRTLASNLQDIVEDNTSDYPRLCRKVVDFWRQPMSLRLEELAEDSSKRAWKTIRHNVGRLDSWFRAASHLISIVKERPSIMANLSIRRVPSLCTAAMPQEWSREGMHDLLQQILPNYNQEILREYVEPAADLQTNSFNKLLNGNPKPVAFDTIVHAEVLMIEHCYINDISPVNDYIGCSKPSCYCCSLYMQCHPMKSEPRPCHGKIWAKWGVPLQHSPHSVDILKKMTRQIQEEIKDCVFRGPASNLRIADSTTGLSRSTLTEDDSGLFDLATPNTRKGRFRSI